MFFHFLEIFWAHKMDWQKVERVDKSQRRRSSLWKTDDTLSTAGWIIGILKKTILSDSSFYVCFFFYGGAHCRNHMALNCCNISNLQRQLVLLCQPILWYNWCSGVLVWATQGKTKSRGWKALQLFRCTINISRTRSGEAISHSFSFWNFKDNCQNLFKIL